MAATVTILPTTGSFTVPPTAPFTEQSAQAIFAGGVAGATVNTGAANVATATVSIPTTAGGTEVVAARATRRSVTIRNLDASTSVYVGSGSITSSNFTLKAGESVPIDTTAQIKALSASGTVSVAAIETYD